MADISKITPPGSQTTYNLKDATARTATQWLDKLNGSKNLLSIYTFERASMYADVQSDGCTVRVHGTGSGDDLTYGTFTVPETGEYSALISIRSGTVTSLYLKTGSEDSVSINTATTPTSLGSLTQGTVCELKSWTATGVTVDFTVSILICKTGVLESGLTDFRPPTLSNTKITPELIELVDSGAKNKLNLNGLTLGLADGFTGQINSDGSVTLSGTTANTASCRIQLGAMTGRFVLSGCPSGGGDSTYRQDIRDSSYNVITGSLDTGNGSDEFTLPSGCYLYFRFAAGTYNNVKFYPMLCSKAAWDVSQKYVPYRPSYEDTVEQVATNKNNILSLMTPKKGSITWETGWTPTSENVSIRQYDNIIVGQIYCRFSTNLPTIPDTQIGTINIVGKPRINFRGIGYVSDQLYDTTTATANVFISESTGGLYVLSGTDNAKAIRFNFVYCTSDPS